MRFEVHGSRAVSERYAVPVERPLHPAEILDEMEVLRACARCLGITDERDSDTASAFDNFLIQVLPVCGERLKSLIADSQYNAELARFVVDVKAGRTKEMPFFLAQIFTGFKQDGTTLH